MKVSTEYPLPKRGLPPIIAENKVHGFEITSLDFPQFDENKRMLNKQRRSALVKWRGSSEPPLLVKVEAGTEAYVEGRLLQLIGRRQGPSSAFLGEI
ncbi:hypothetical protein AVEN_225500-1 [Araneus ventricosus]|uniref:Uncharacterized protein n=1 Tax=Araneus ventricosus TaxID=182803 RepID=A0A4Y2EBN4_ARAVE|nr:hypothetical protein AVEN_225500-1 [Araneus ventricosus]